MDLPTGPQPVQFVVSIGNVHATPQYVVTPSGSWPLGEVNVSATDQTHVTTHTPTWAIVLCLIFVWFFLLSLLFLLAKETRVSGFVTVGVAARNGQAHVENIPVMNDVQRADVFHRVGYLQSLVGQARWLQGR